MTITTNVPKSPYEILQSNSSFSETLSYSADAEGASPTNNPQDNSAALQSCLTKAQSTGGIVTLNNPGVYASNATLIIGSNTHLKLGKGVKWQQANGISTNLVRNVNWQSSVITVTNGITSASSALTGRYIATADCGTNAHGFSPGNYVFIKGDTSGTYIGIWQVLATPSPTTFTFLISAVAGTAPGASSGTITAEQSDANIIIEGEFDYNGFNNQANVTYESHAFLFNKVRNLLVINTKVKEAVKYCFLIGNSWGTHFQNVEMDSASDGIHYLGWTYMASGYNVSGQTGDDFVAWNAENGSFTNEDIPLGNVTPGNCVGLDFRALKIYRGAAHGVALYPSSTNVLSGVYLESVQDMNNSLTHWLLIDLPSGNSTCAQATAVRDITLSKCSGTPITNLIKIGGSVASSGSFPAVTVDKLLLSDLEPSSTIPYHAIQLTGARVKNLEVRSSKIDFNMTAAVRGLISYDANTQIDRARILNNEFQASVGGSGAVVFSANVAGTTAQCFFRGNTLPALMQFGAGFGNNPYLEIDNNFFASYSIIRSNYGCTLNIHDNVVATSGVTPPILLFGSSYNTTLMMDNNHFGTATNFLQIGTASTDAFTTNTYIKGNMSNPGVDAGINFFSTNTAFNIRASDASFPVDASKVSTIAAGCIVRRTNATAGIYAYGSSAALISAT